MSLQIPWLFTINDFQSLKEGYLKEGTEAVFLRKGEKGVTRVEENSSKLPPAMLTSRGPPPIHFCYNQYF